MLPDKLNKFIARKTMDKFIARKTKNKPNINYVAWCYTNKEGILVMGIKFKKSEKSTYPLVSAFRKIHI